MNVNKCIMGGRLTRDSEMRESAQGVKFCNFTLAVNRNKNEVEFIKCVAFNKAAEIITDYTKKGDELLIEGQLKQNKNEAKACCEIITEKVYLIGGKKEG